MPPLQSIGITVTLGTSGFEFELLDIDPIAEKVGMLDTSHQGTVDYATFIAEPLIDAGSIKGNGHYDPSATTRPKLGTAEQVTITWPLDAGQTSAATSVANIVWEEFSVTAKFKAKITFDFSWKVSGGWTHTPGA